MDYIIFLAREDNSFFFFYKLRYQIQIKLPFYVYRFFKLEILFFFISPPWFQKKIEFGMIFNDLHHHQNKAKLAGHFHIWRLKDQSKQGQWRQSQHLKMSTLAFARRISKSSYGYSELDLFYMDLTAWFDAFWTPKSFAGTICHPDPWSSALHNVPD